MATEGISADEAFDILCRASQRTNVKLRDIAAQIVAASGERKVKTWWTAIEQGPATT